MGIIARLLKKAKDRGTITAADILADEEVARICVSPKVTVTPYKGRHPISGTSVTVAQVGLHAALTHILDAHRPDAVFFCSEHGNCMYVL